MPLLCHTVTEHGWVIVKYSAPSRAGEEEGGDDHGADGDGEVEEVAEEGGVSRSKIFLLERRRKKNNNRTDRRTTQTLRNGSTQKAGRKRACEAELLTYHGVRKDCMAQQGPSTLCFHRPASSTAAAHIKRVRELG